MNKNTVIDEFSLIDKYFNWNIRTNALSAKTTLLGIGDDAAVLGVPEKKQLVVTTDTLIAGVHFPVDTSPHAIGHKSLAVSLSDLAAMGADPAWFTLALTLPEVNEQWLEEFSVGLKTLAEQYAVQLVGGDTTKGELSITIQAMGWVDPEQVLTRSGAQHQDKIYVSNTLGDAAAGLGVLQEKLFLDPYDATECVSQLEYPQPQHSLSRLIRGFATSCIDVSDGLISDLQHILKASNVGAKVNVSKIPRSSVLKKLDKKKAFSYALAGGDDYELLFTIKSRDEFRFLEFVEKRDLKVTCIGEINEGYEGIEFEPTFDLESHGYKHF
jgi:thiamine-monophosphate kinase